MNWKIISILLLLSQIISGEREREREREKNKKEQEPEQFYDPFRCPSGSWSSRFPFSSSQIHGKPTILRRFQKAMEACDGYSRPAFRSYLQRHYVYEDPEWVKPVCQEYSAEGRNRDYRCLLKDSRELNTRNISKYNLCYKGIKCRPQIQFSDNGKVVCRPTYKAGSNSIKQMLRCTFGDVRGQWPCDGKGYTLSHHEAKYTVIHMTRDPIQRFASALIEQVTRFQNPSKMDLRRLQLTQWYGLSQTNAPIATLTEGFLRDIECNIAHPWWSHGATTAWFMIDHFLPGSNFDGGGPVSEIDYIFRLESFPTQWKQFLDNLDVTKPNVNKNRECKITNQNQHSDPHHVQIPKNEILNHIHSNPALIRRLCAIYFTDFICFDYPLPPPCEHMLHPHPGVCPLFAPQNRTFSNKRG